jgi:flagellin
MQPVANSTSLVAIKAIHTANTAVAQASERISTGLRVNRASDDPAGLRVANQLSVKVASYSKVVDNLNMAASVAQVVDDSLSKIQESLSQMKLLAQSSINTSSEAVRSANQQQLLDYQGEITSIANNAVWGDKNLMDGSTASMSFQSGPSAGDTIQITLQSMTASALSVAAADLSVGSLESATAAIPKIEAAINNVSSYQARIGAKENVINFRASLTDELVMNYSAAYGNIMNADLAQETANLASAQIQRDAATAMLAQSNGMNKEIVNFLLKSSLN